MTFQESESDPLSFLASTAKQRNRMVLTMQGHRHWVTSGHLDHSAASAELRDRFLYDGKWECIECREYLEWKEGARILAGFKNHEMWVTVLSESDQERAMGSLRDRVRRRAARIEVQFVTVPTFPGRLAVLTTGSFDESSQQVADHAWFLLQTLMPTRWKYEDGAGISSTRGFLPPARRLDFWEAYRKDPADRCWHLHTDRDEARQCADILSVESKDAQRWYTRATSEWHQIGKTTIYGSEALSNVAKQCGIRYSVEESRVAAIIFEPLTWDDPRLQRFLHLTGWQPPHPDWTPPRLEMQYRVTSNRGLVTGSATGWKPKSKAG